MENNEKKKLTDEELNALPGNVSKQTTSADQAGTNTRDEDAADDDYANSDTSKSFDRDQEELDLGLEDGDLDTDVDTNH